MVRIRGHIGDWPVDLTLELDEADWARLAVAAAQAPSVAVSTAAPASAAGDRLWLLAQELLRQSGELEGPQLLGQLAGLAGSMEAGKRLLVRLRHSPQVQVETGADASLYRWLETAGP